MVGDSSSSTRSSSSSSSSPYMIMCDAGSTGTRLYIYQRHPHNNRTTTTTTTFDNDSDNDNDISIQVGTKVKPGLSAQTPDTVVDYLLPSLQEATTKIPSQYHSRTSVYVYATGGMRLLSNQQQEEMYNALVDGLLQLPQSNINNNNNNNINNNNNTQKEKEKEIPLFRIERQNFKTIDGSLEGYFAALAVNYLAGRVRSDLRIKDGGGELQQQLLLGALDLGGASAQIVIPVLSSSMKQQQQQEQQRKRQGFLRKEYALSTQQKQQQHHHHHVVQRQDFVSKSILGVGSEEIRPKLERYLPTLSYPNDRFVKLNPCYFHGYTTTIQSEDTKDHYNGIEHIGTGNGKECLQVMRDVLRIHTNCTTTTTTTTRSSSLLSFSSFFWKDQRRQQQKQQPYCNILGLPTNHEKDQEELLKTGGNFYAMTLYYHVIHFVRDVLDVLLEDDGDDNSLKTGHVHKQRQQLDVPNPTIKTLRDVTDTVCSWDYDFLKRHNDVYASGTSLDKMPHRCLELALVVTLLESFGFDDNDATVYFVDTIHDQQVEWTLGAFLHQVNNHDNNNQEKDVGAVKVQDSYDSVSSSSSSSPSLDRIEGIATTTATTTTTTTTTTSDSVYPILVISLGLLTFLIISLRRNGAVKATRHVE